MIKNRFYKRCSIADAVSAAAMEESWLRRTFEMLPQYDAGCDYALRAVPLSSMRPLSIVLLSRRLLIAENMLRLFIQYGLSAYCPAKLEYQQLSQLVLPPIVRREGGIFIICDGTHRLFAARAAGLETCQVAIITGSREPLPGTPASWESIAVHNEDRPIEQKFVDFAPQFFSKPFTVDANSERWWKLKQGESGV